MREKCEKHGVTDCLMCNRAKVPVAVAMTHQPLPVSAAPSEITGAPPVDIEMMSKEALKAELLASKLPDAIFDPEPPFQVPGKDDNPAVSYPATASVMDISYDRKDAFDTLPTDDSHASKVVRAAAEYASATRDWAQELARVEKIKASLLTAEASLSAAQFRKDASEFELKELVSGPPSNSHMFHYPVDEGEQE